MFLEAMYHDPSPPVAQSAQLVLFRDWDRAAPGSAVDTLFSDPNPEDQGLVGALDRVSLWSRVAALVSGERCRFGDATDVALRELAAVYASNAATAQKVTAEVVRFARFCRASGVEFVDELTAGHVESFVWTASKRRGVYADVSSTTAANRQSFVRRYFDTLTTMNLWAGGDIVGRPIRRDLGETSRVLTADELHQVHVYADAGLFRSNRVLLVAFAEAGADARETGCVTLDDIDLAENTVRLHGMSERVNPLTEWGAATVRDWLEANRAPASGPLCVSSHLTLEKAAQSITVRVREVLNDAGLSGRARVTPRSIRLTIARQVLDASGIEGAARFLGNQSLDATANALNHQWWVD